MAGAMDERIGGVALGGFMGVGKSRTARRLAERLGWPLADTDELLTARYGPISDWFDLEGEAVFRRRERALVRELCARAGPMVVATGGGVWADDASRELLRRRFATVVLSAPLEILRQRVGGRAGRPLWSEGAGALLASRQAAYAQADLQLSSAQASPDELAQRIADWLSGSWRGPGPGSRVSAAAGGRMDRRVVVDLGGRSYPVVLSTGAYEGLGAALAERTPRRRVVLCTERTVQPLWAEAALAGLRAAGLRVETVVLPSGEAHKHRQTWSECVDALLALGVDRRTPVLALGGGVLGDIVGFAAATTLRGMPFVQLPTTLLAMVDSSVGGKTGVNHSRGKNLIGAFHQPVLVYAALATLGTLPAAERLAGLGEVVKTALLGDADLLDRIEAEAAALRAGEAAALAPVIARCVEIKAEVVSADERESGWRAVLNAGHTVAHGIEAALGYGVLRHGEAVGIGLVCESRWAVRVGLCEDPELPGRIARILDMLGLRSTLPQLDRERVVQAMGLDKKADGDKLSLPIPVRAGQMRLETLPLSRLPELLGDPA